LRPWLLSEGLTTRTSLSRISCHSSVVKVQRPRRDGPRRRRRMMRPGGRGVKPRDRAAWPVGTADATPGEAARANPMDPSEGCQTPAEARRIGSDRAALHDDHERGATQPTQQGELCRAVHAKRADQDEIHHQPENRGGSGLGQT